MEQSQQTERMHILCGYTRYIQKGHLGYIWMWLYEVYSKRTLWLYWNNGVSVLLLLRHRLTDYQAKSNFHFYSVVAFLRVHAESNGCENRYFRQLWNARTYNEVRRPSIQTKTIVSELNQEWCDKPLNPQIMHNVCVEIAHLPGQKQTMFIGLVFLDRCWHDGDNLFTHTVTRDEA